MTTLFLVLSILGLALTVNAWRPVRWVWASVFVFFPGWLTAELAPLLLLIHIGVVTWFVAGGAVVGSAGWVAIGLSGAIAVGLAAIIVDAARSREVLDAALTEALGVRYEAVAARGRARLRAARRHLLPLLLWERDVKRVRNVSYGPHGKRNLLDVYAAKEFDGEGPRPVLLYIHGGGWVTVSHKDHQGKPLMLHLASQGWICVAANYRLSPRATWPEHIVDVKRAIAWVKQNIAEYGGDPDFIMITGGSAGGHLSALAALTPNDPAFQPEFEDVDTTVQAAVPSYGVYDFTTDSGTMMSQRRLFFLEKVIVKQKLADARETFEGASPHFRAHRDAPPFFLIHGANDSLVPVDEGRAFARRLREVSTSPVAYAELDHTQHAFDVFHSIRTTHVVRAIERFGDWAYEQHRARTST